VGVVLQQAADLRKGFADTTLRRLYSLHSLPILRGTHLGAEATQRFRSPGCAVTLRPRWRHNPFGAFGTSHPTSVSRFPRLHQTHEPRQCPATFPQKLPRTPLTGP